MGSYSELYSKHLWVNIPIIIVFFGVTIIGFTLLTMTIYMFIKDIQKFRTEYTFGSILEMTLFAVLCATGVIYGAHRIYDINIERGAKVCTVDTFTAQYDGRQDPEDLREAVWLTFYFEDELGREQTFRINTLTKSVEVGDTSCITYILCTDTNNSARVDRVILSRGDAEAIGYYRPTVTVAPKNNNEGGE